MAEEVRLVGVVINKKSREVLLSATVRQLRVMGALAWAGAAAKTEVGDEPGSGGGVLEELRWNRFRVAQQQAEREQQSSGTVLVDVATISQAQDGIRALYDSTANIPLSGSLCEDMVQELQPVAEGFEAAAQVLHTIQTIKSPLDKPPTPS